MAFEAPQVIGRRADWDHLQRLFLDAGRVSVLAGWLVVTYSFGNPAADATHVFLGFTMLLLGVFLLAFSPAAYQLPWVPRAGAFVAKAALNYLFDRAGEVA
uniref:Uncharacterized protein n=1 Tax=Aegilops tauschii TaxID=37682 RepID=N1R5Q8_AEGTA